jgi:anti-anti-sigma factor
LDVANLRFIDAAGLRALIRLRDAVESVNGDLCFEGSSPALDRLLHILALENYFLRRTAQTTDI